MAARRRKKKKKEACNKEVLMEKTMLGAAGWPYLSVPSSGQFASPSPSFLCFRSSIKPAATRGESENAFEAETRNVLEGTKTEEKETD